MSVFAPGFCCSHRALLFTQGAVGLSWYVMPYYQTQLKLPARPRGFHLITREILEALPDIENLHIGLLYIFIQHTSASLTVNENTASDVRGDFERHFNVMVPEDAPYYEHTYEGADDMPAHIKASLLGASLTLPIHQGDVVLGTWQGIYLCEHRDHGGQRILTLTAHGEAS